MRLPTAGQEANVERVYLSVERVPSGRPIVKANALGSADIQSYRI